MITVQECDEKTIKKIAAALAKAAMGQRIAFVFEEGMHRIEDQGQVFAQPNGTATFRLFINGGAQDSGVPEKKTDVDDHGREGTREEPVATLIPALEAHTDRSADGSGGADAEGDVGAGAAATAEA